MTQQELKELVFYDKDTGEFYCNKTKRKLGCVKIEKRKNRQDYKRFLVGIKNKQYKAHRLAFLYMLGYIPQYVDHIDGDATNNKWQNLRPANLNQNSQNSKLKITNTSGYKGVTRYNYSKNKHWKAYIKVNAKSISLGLFETKEQAAEAYNKAALMYFGEYTHLNKLEKK